MRLAVRSRGITREVKLYSCGLCTQLADAFFHALVLLNASDVSRSTLNAQGQVDMVAKLMQSRH
jgi:phosphoribosyl-ATP pyrophosphohydrolase